MKKQNVRTLGLIVCTLTYLLIGAAIFDAIESEEEQRQKEALEKLEEQMLGKYNISNADFVLLEELVHLTQPYKAGKPWKFAGSFYYATTVLTTIGYGHSTPKTYGGKLFTMVYAMIGIPLGLVMFNSIGERLNNFSSIVINKLRRLFKAKQEETTEMDLICVVSSLSAIVATAGAAAFSHYEGWSYFHSIYYCFVTLTTIGFGDYVALQQDNSLEKKPEYVTFALFFIMFGLAIIAASLNLMVLKFMTMNTEDEKRDEQQAIQAAAQHVRLDGDVILQQNEVLHWQAEGAGSMEEIRSVCSCTCNSCNPFQQINSRYPNETFQLTSTAEDEERRRKTKTRRRRKKKRKWFGRRSRSQDGRSDDIEDDEDDEESNSEAVETSRGVTPTTTLDDYCDYKERMRRSKADSVHDLRRSTVSSVLRLPPSTPPHLRPASRAKSCCAAASQQRLGSAAGSREMMESVTFLNRESSRQFQRRRRGRSRTKDWLNRLLQWPPQLVVLSQSSSGGENDNWTEKRESYALDEVGTVKVVPKAKNANHHKRVSL